MKTTVDIPESELQDAMKYTKARTKRGAIVTALVDYNRRQRMAELVKYSGTSDAFLSNDAIEALDRQDWKSSKSTRRKRGQRQ